MGRFRIVGVPRRLLLMMGLGLFFVLWLGCDESDDDSADDDDAVDDDDDDVDDDDDDDDDDDSAADDDDSAPDDDDSGDDDTYEGPCEYAGDWTSVIGSEDPQGDADGYLCDIRDYQYEYDGTTLYLRILCWDTFDDHDPAAMFDMCLSDGTYVTILSWDHVQPGPLVLWSNSNGYEDPLPSPASFQYCADEPESIVLAIDLADINLDGQTSLLGAAAVDLYAGYLDEHPDDGGFVEFPLIYEPELVIASAATDDTAAGDGDQILDPGETIQLTVEVLNEGWADTGGQVTATASLAASSTGAATLTAANVLYDGGAVIAPHAIGSPDVSFEFEIDAGALAGQQLIFDLAVVDDGGHSWSLQTDPYCVLCPMEIPPTEILLDGDDVDDPFDIASVSYLVSGGELRFQIESHSVHAADTEVSVFIDTDLDGDSNYALSSYDSDAGTYTGGFFQHDGANWNQIGTPSSFVFAAGSSSLGVGVPTSALGQVPFMAVFVRASDIQNDFAPDTYAAVETRALVSTVTAPYIRLLTTPLAEVTGNGDVVIDPGEEWELGVEIENAGLAAADAVVGTLSSTDVDLTVLSGALDFGTVAPGDAAMAAVPASFSVDGGASPTSVYDLDLAISPAGYLFGFTVEVGLGVRPGDTAEDAALVPAAGIYAGDTSGLSNDYENPVACTNFTASGNDGVYAVYLTSGETLDIELTYDSYPPDAVLYISDDPAQPDLACLAGADLLTGASEALSYTAVTDGVHYIVVDQYYSGGGTYSLELDF